MTRYFSADHHFGHTKTIKWSGRPFANYREADKAFIDNHNALVTEDDDFYFAGDFLIDPKYYFYLEMLEFRHCYFALGNHDKEEELRRKIEKSEYLRDRVEVANHFEIDLAGHRVFVIHKPLHASRTMPTICGHVHGRWTLKEPGAHYIEHSLATSGQTRQFEYPVLNVGVDAHGYKPVSEHEVVRLLGLSVRSEVSGISSAV